MSLQPITMPTMQIAAAIGDPSPKDDLIEKIDVLVIVAHPDDETLMCGGTIAKHVKNGEKVRVLILSEGVDSRMDATNVERLARLKACDEASNILGCNGEVLTYPDQRFDTVARLDIIHAIEKRIEQYRPNTVYTHKDSDPNLDHMITSDAVSIACRARPGCSVKLLLMGEVPSSVTRGIPFAPNWFVDISETMPDKLKALICYKDEMRDPPHPRSNFNVGSMSMMRGASVGVEYAEAFVLARVVA